MLTISPPKFDSNQTEENTTHSNNNNNNVQRPTWVPNSEVTSCTSCEHEFSMFFRRHHCRACVNIFCASCSQYQSTIPELGYFRPTRVCKMCVQRCSSHVTPPHSARKPAFPRSPALPSSKGRSFGRMIENHMSSSPVAAAAGASAVSRKKVALSHHQSVQRNRNDAHPESSSSQRKLIFSSSSQNKDHSSTSAKLGQLTPSTSAVRLM